MRLNRSFRFSFALSLALTVGAAAPAFADVLGKSLARSSRGTTPRVSRYPSKGVWAQFRKVSLACKIRGAHVARG